MNLNRAAALRAAWFSTILVIGSLFTAPGRAAQPRPDLGLLEAPDLARSPSTWVVLDARPRADWLVGHIPGARSLSWEDYTRTDPRGVPYKILPPTELAAALGELGIDERTPVVVYGDADKSWGGEGWVCWALENLGHRGPVRLLAGGVQAWKRQGLPLTPGAERAAKAVRYQPAPRPELAVETAELRRNGAACSIVDTRSTLEWLGDRVPGAVHIPWDDFFAGDDRRPLAPDAVRRLLEKHGVTLAKPVVYYCAGGIRSAYAWTVHRLAGLPDAHNYEGGMEEWKRVP